MELKVLLNYCVCSVSVKVALQNQAYISKMKTASKIQQESQVVKENKEEKKSEKGFSDKEKELEKDESYVSGGFWFYLIFSFFADFLRI